MNSQDVKIKFTMDDTKIASNCLDRLNIDDCCYCQYCDFIPLCDGKLSQKISNHFYQLYLDKIEDI